MACPVRTDVPPSPRKAGIPPDFQALIARAAETK
jgi:hypothetical protein